MMCICSFVQDFTLEGRTITGGGAQKNRAEKIRLPSDKYAA